MRVPSETSTQLVRDTFDGFWSQEAFENVKNFSEAAGLPDSASRISEKINVFVHFQELQDERNQTILLIRTCAEFNGQSDIEELPVYIGQKWPSESLELTCWADDDSLNIEIIGSMVGAVRRKYQISEDREHMLLTTTLVKTSANEISCKRYFNRQLPMF